MEHTVDNLIQNPLNNFDGHKKYTINLPPLSSTKIFNLPLQCKNEKRPIGQHRVNVMISGGEELTAAIIHSNVCPCQPRPFCFHVRSTVLPGIWEGDKKSSQLYCCDVRPHTLLRTTMRLHCKTYRFNDPPCTPCAYNIVKERPATKKLET